MYKFFLTFWHVLNCRCCRLTLINLEEFPGWLLFTWSHWMIFLAGCPRRDSPCFLHCYKSNWWANNWCLYIQCGSFWGWAIFQQNPSKTFYVIVFKLIFVNNDNNSNHHHHYQHYRNNNNYYSYHHFKRMYQQIFYGSNLISG